MSGRRIGVYVCHCGRNISDHRRRRLGGRRGAAGKRRSACRQTVFTCSDATQQEIVQDIRAAA
jgi:heterodisulfide reductase subunit A